jgi:anaphase-promoting complex subunit 4
VTSLLSVPYRSALGDNAAAYTIPYSPYAQSRPPKPTVFSNEEALERFSGYEIASGGPFVPETIEIRGHGGRKGSDEAKRIVILGSDRMQYKVFKLATRNASIGRTADEDISMT